LQKRRRAALTASLTLAQLEFGPSFHSFTRQRARLLMFLKSLPEKTWSRTIVTGGGPPRERAVLFYACTPIGSREK